MTSLHATEDVSSLARLGEVAGIDPAAPDETRRRLLTAMGYAAATDADVRRSWQKWVDAESARWMEPVYVIREGEVSVTLRGKERPDVEGELILEDGTELPLEPRLEATADDRWMLSLPATLPIGYHRLQLRRRDVADVANADASLIVAPERGVVPSDLHAEGARGIWMNLYSVRSANNVGFGDFGDLDRVVASVAGAGGNFVGLNPLHSIRNTQRECSPYSPISRLFVSELYLDLTRVPEWNELSHEARERYQSEPVQREIARLRAGDRLDYDGVRAFKEEWTAELHRLFVIHHLERDTPRARDYRAFLERHGERLRLHATFLALDVVFERRVRGWRDWPARYRDPRSSAVERFAGEHREEIDRACYVQFELDRQIGTIAAECDRFGMRLGLYRDLAIGAAAEGSDTWGDPTAFVFDASVGAPPDGFSSTGQVWELPPVHPVRLRESGYRSFIDLLRANLRHSRLLRIDHVIGLVRQFWIPAGRPGNEGAFVRFPAQDLFAILALESQRHRAVVVGEDLGTVPDELRPLMEKNGILRSSVVLFELSDQGLPARDALPRSSLATVVTHDHTPLKGFLGATDLPLLQSLGLIQAEDLTRLVEERHRLVASIVRQLRELGELDAEDPPLNAIVAAIHRWFGGVECALRAISLDDLAGETTPVNVPTARSDRYPVWSRRMTRDLDEILPQLSLGVADRAE